MAYSVESINGCTRKIVFNFEELDLSKEIESAVKEKRKSVNIKGFRKGKAPLDMVEKIYGPQIESDALNRFVQNQLYDAIQKEDLKVVGIPSFENLKYDPGKSVSFDAKVEIFPDFELKSIDSYSFSKDKVEVTDEELDLSKKSYLESKAQTEEVKEEGAELKNGQIAVINFEGEKESGERPPEMKGEDFLLEIGSNRFIPGFEESCVGMKKGEKRDVPLSFPEDYHAEDLRGAKVKFEVELLEIKEKRFPNLTDDLAKELGFESVSDLEEKNKDGILKRKEREADEKLKQEVLEKLVADNEFDVPLALVVQQENHLKQDLKNTLTQQGLGENEVEEYFEKWKGDVLSKAQFQVRSGLILDKLAKDFEVESSDSDLEEKIKEISAETKIPEEEVRKYYLQNEKVKTNMLYALREEKTFDKLFEKLKIS